MQDRAHALESRRGFAHAWINGHFRPLDDGEKIFYPLGAFGRRGFAVSSIDQELALRANLRRLQRIVPRVSTGLILFLGIDPVALESWQLSLIAIASCLIFWIVVRAYFRAFTRHMEPIDIPNSFVSTWKSVGTTVHPMLLIAHALFVGFLSGFTFFNAFQEQSLARFVISVVIATMLIPNGVALWSWRQTWVSAG